MTKAKVVYGCPYIEVESGWGSRPYGWRLFLDVGKAKRRVRSDSNKGETLCGDYYGPIRPIRLFEIPFSCLTRKMKADLTKNGVFCTEDFWDPKFSSFLCEVD